MTRAFQWICSKLKGAPCCCCLNGLPDDMISDAETGRSCTFFRCLTLVQTATWLLQYGPHTINVATWSHL